MQGNLRKTLEGMLKNAPPSTDRAQVLADLARNLADRIDDGCEDRYAAGVAKEFRTTVDALDSLGGTTDAFDELAKRLSAKVVDATD
ncbi:MAG: hypothetical protein ACPGWS_10210 [Solirubrobacterales bacterium]